MIITCPPRDRKKSGTKKESVQRLMNYIAAPQKQEKTLFTGSVNMEANDENFSAQMEEMIDLAEANERCRDPIFHAVLSFRDGEVPTREQCDEAVHIYMQELDMQDNEVYWGVHQNTDNIHIHLCINRINPLDFSAKRAVFFKIKNEIAARKIEVTQGWQIENSGRFKVVDGEVVEKSRAERHNDQRALSKKVRDGETRTGFKSALRHVRENGDVMTLLFNATSWAELHEGLHKAGLKIIKANGGGKIAIRFPEGERYVKISDVSKQLSMRKLEARLGEFAPSEIPGDVPQTEHEPIMKLDGFDEYKKQCDEFYRTIYAKKKKAFDDFKKVTAAERAELKERQKRYRSDYFVSIRGTYKGKRIWLNAQRSVIADEQIIEREQLRLQQQRRREDLLALFSQKFPSYKEWLLMNDKERDAQMWRYRNTLSGVLSGDEYNLPQPSETAQGQFFGKTVITVNSSFVRYYNKHKDNQIAFIDMGKSIKVFDWRDRETALASLKLAQKKWGVFRINGSDEYKRMCVELAVEHGFTFKNKDLQQRVEQLRKERDEQKKAKMEEAQKMRTRQADLFRRYHVALGATHYRVTAIKMDQDGSKKPWIVGKPRAQQDQTDSLPAYNGFTPEELTENMSKLIGIDRSGRNIYYTPLSDDYHYIVIDDVTHEKLNQLTRDGYSPAVVIESSPGNFQCVLKVQKLGLEQKLESQLANQLVMALNKQYGDPNFSGVRHPHRAPGFRNQKEKHKQEDGSFPEVKLCSAENRTCEKAVDQLKEIYAAELQRRQREPVIPSVELPASGTITPEQAYLIHAADVMRRQAVNDYSRLDAKIAVRMVATGYTYEQIQAAIETCAPQIRPESERNKHNWADYARRTADYLQRPNGKRAVIDALEHRLYLLRVEGRLPRWAQEQTTEQTRTQTQKTQEQIRQTTATDKTISRSSGRKKDDKYLGR